MKVSKLWAVATLALALVSCKNEPAKEASQRMKFPVEISLDGGKGALRAEQVSSSLSASYDNERKVENLTIAVFTHNETDNVPDALEKVVTQDELTMPTSGNPYDGAIKFDMGIEGDYDLEVIANAYMNDTEKAAFTAKLKPGMSYDQFKEVIAERALPQHGETGFAMLSTEPVKVSTKEQTTAHAGKIILRRLACRFDVFNKLVEDLELTKVTLQNQITKSYILEQNDVPANADGGAKEYTANGDWFNATLVSGGIYSYENPVKGAIKLLLEGTYKGAAWQKTIELKKDGKTLPTLRNHIYRVILTKGNGTTPGGGDNGGGKDDPANADKINYVIEVLDWNEDAAIDYRDDDVRNAEFINPLAFVAETNIDQTGNAFVADKYAWDKSAFYDFDTAVEKFSHITIDGKKYHLPSWYEWKSVIPCYNNETFPGEVAFSQDNALDMRDKTDKDVVVDGKSMDCLQDLKYAAHQNVCYALRFKGTKYQSAWRYSYEQVDGYKAVLRIKVRNVLNGVTIDNVADEAFWGKNNESDLERIFPASGWCTEGNSLVPSDRAGKGSYFWSSTPEPTNEDFARGVAFSETGAICWPITAIYFKSWGRCIRLFQDKL